MDRRPALGTAVICDDEAVVTTFDDGRVLRTPITEFGFLVSATPAQRRDCQLDELGTVIYWPSLDEYVGVDYILGVTEEDVLDLAGSTRVMPEK